MERFKSVDEILDFAIEKETEAYQFYTDWAERLDDPVMSEVFREFAQQEMGHKEKLLKVKEGKLQLTVTPEGVPDLKISDYLVEIKPHAAVSYQEALIVAMQREKASFRLYNDLAVRAESQELRNLFLALAQEEARHKLRLEIAYDDLLYPEG